MKIRSNKPKYSGKDAGGSHKFKHKVRFERSVFNRFAGCPHILEYSSRARSSIHPCRDQDARTNYHPGNFKIADQNWYEWLENANLKGRVVVKLHFNAWYSTILRDSIEEMVSESMVIRLEFQHKSDAAMFKLIFADPQLEWLTK